MSTPLVWVVQVLFRSRICGFEASFSLSWHIITCKFTVRTLPINLFFRLSTIVSSVVNWLLSLLASVSKLCIIRFFIPSFSLMLKLKLLSDSSLSLRSITSFWSFLFSLSLCWHILSTDYFCSCKQFYSANLVLVSCCSMAIYCLRILIYFSLRRSRSYEASTTCFC